VIVKVREWYSARTKREQQLLLLMAGLAIPVLAWLIVMVMNGAYDKALQRHLEAVDRHGRILALADTLKGSPAGATAEPQADLQVTVTEAAGQAGQTLQSANASGPNSIDIAITGTTAPLAAQWLHDLQQRGIFVEQLRMSPQPDGTLSLSATLTRRG
jgi:general secretion pathway protein M